MVFFRSLCTLRNSGFFFWGGGEVTVSFCLKSSSSLYLRGGLAIKLYCTQRKVDPLSHIHSYTVIHPTPPKLSSFHQLTHILRPCPLPPRYLFDPAHRVDGVLGFFSSRPNWDSSTPSPEGEFAPPPLGSGRGTQSFAGGGGWGDSNSDEGTDTVL